MPPSPALIAVVDDEDAVRKALKRLLLSAGFEVDVHADGRAFLSSLRARAPHCVVLDLHMPHISGLEVQERLTAARSTLPVIVITGHDSDSTRATALANGASAYLRKPVDEQVLLDAIAVAISRQAPTSA
jgi:FixJ family two-component response regulator